MRYMILTLSLLVLPVSGFADDTHTVTHTHHYKMTKHSAAHADANANRTHMTTYRSGYSTGNRPVNYEDSRYQKWASMTAEERDLAKQRSEVSYKDWQHYQTARNAQMNRRYQHHPDPWAGKTAEEKDMIMQRNSAYERAHPRDDGRNHPTAWQNMTAEEKDAIKQRNSIYERSHPTQNGHYYSGKQASRMSAAEQAKETKLAQERARMAAEAQRRRSRR